MMIVFIIIGIVALLLLGALAVEIIKIMTHPRE